MKELIRTNDPIKLSYVSALLSSEGIETVIFDSHTSFAEGTIPVIQQRVMVADDDAMRADILISTDDKLSSDLAKGEGGVWS